MTVCAQQTIESFHVGGRHRCHIQVIPPSFGFPLFSASAVPVVHLKRPMIRVAAGFAGPAHSHDDGKPPLLVGGFRLSLLCFWRAISLDSPSSSRSRALLAPIFVVAFASPKIMLRMLRLRAVAWRRSDWFSARQAARQIGVPSSPLPRAQNVRFG